MANKQNLATITIMIKDRQTHAPEMNQLLTEYGHIIMARLGVNVQPACIEHCTGYIAIVVKTTLPEINKLTKELNDLYGIIAKNNIMTN